MTKIGIVGCDTVVFNFAQLQSSEITTTVIEPAVKAYTITRPPELKEVFIDPNIQTLNYKKHIQTCIKNRKKRKKRKKNK